MTSKCVEVFGLGPLGATCRGCAYARASDDEVHAFCRKGLVAVDLDGRSCMMYRPAHLGDDLTILPSGWKQTERTGTQSLAA